MEEAQANYNNVNSKAQHEIVARTKKKHRSFHSNSPAINLRMSPLHTHTTLCPHPSLSLPIVFIVSFVCDKTMSKSKAVYVIQ